MTKKKLHDYWYRYLTFPNEDFNSRPKCTGTFEQLVCPPQQTESWCESFSIHEDQSQYSSEHLNTGIVKQR